MGSSDACLFLVFFCVCVFFPSNALLPITEFARNVTWPSHETSVRTKELLRTGHHTRPLTQPQTGPRAHTHTDTATSGRGKRSLGDGQDRVLRPSDHGVSAKLFCADAVEIAQSLFVSSCVALFLLGSSPSITNRERKKIIEKKEREIQKWTPIPYAQPSPLVLTAEEVGLVLTAGFFLQRPPPAAIFDQSKRFILAAFPSSFSLIHLTETSRFTNGVRRSRRLDSAYAFRYAYIEKEVIMTRIHK